MKKVFITSSEHENFHRIVTLYTLEELFNYLDENINKEELLESLKSSIEEDNNCPNEIENIMKLDIIVYDKEGNPTTIDKISKVNYENFIYLYRDEFEEVTEDNIDKLKLMSDLDVIELTTHTITEYYNFDYNKYVEELKRLVDIGKQAQDLLDKYNIN